MLPNLMQLNVRDNEISDLAPLSKLRFLQKLNLRGNAVKDLSPLAQMTSLTYLNIHSNSDIGSIEPLKNLINLNTVIMEDVPIRDQMQVLAGLQQLRYLNMRYCGVKDLTPIAQLAGLEYLNLYSNPEIPSIKPLQSLGNLKTLILGNIPIGNELDTLENLTKLTYLNLRNTDLTDISPLARLVNLEYLNLHSNPEIKSILPLQSLTNLQTLILRNVPVGKQIEIMGSFPNLRKLNLQNSGITDIAVLSDLMARGILQDNPKQSVQASVDISDNPIPRGPSDLYADLRPFWENITERQPLNLPFYAALRAPDFSKQAGFYEESFLLELSTDEPGASIYYTLDGSEPTELSTVYTDPILIASRRGEPDVYSAIEAISKGWKKPEGEVTKATVVRAKVINRVLNQNSETSTKTFFVGTELKNRYNLPVVSLVTDGKNFFDDETGIYVLGEAYDEQEAANLTEDERQTYANYNQSGRAWERPVSIELFETGGQPAFNQNGGVRIQGGRTKRFPKKSLRFYARSDYALQDFFEYPLFGSQAKITGAHSAQVYKMFLLRNSGQDWNKSIFRDTFVQSLANQTRLDTQAGRLAVVFLNGEYWGVYTLQERYDEYYLVNHYGIEPGQAVILRQSGSLFRGNPDDEKQYSEIADFMSKNSLSDPKNYAYIQTRLDVDNYIDYLIMEIFSGNDDWPDNNIYLWRMKTDQYEPDAPYGQDGRWRWMLFDMDFGFGLKHGAEDYKRNTFNVAQRTTWSGFPFNHLMENEEFKTTFINRFADWMNTQLLPARVISILDQTQAKLRPEIEENFRRWETKPNPLEEWEEEVDSMRTFALMRPDAVRQQIKDLFGLEEGVAILTLKTDQEKGYLRINSIDINSSTPGVYNPDEWKGTYFRDVPVTITAFPNPGFKFTGWEEIVQNKSSNLT